MKAFALPAKLVKVLAAIAAIGEATKELRYEFVIWYALSLSFIVVAGLPAMINDPEFITAYRTAYEYDYQGAIVQGGGLILAPLMIAFVCTAMNVIVAAIFNVVVPIKKPAYPVTELPTVQPGASQSGPEGLT